MGFKQEVLGKLERLEDRIGKLQIQNLHIEVLKEEIFRLRQQNEKLLDRVMTRSFEELKIYSPSEGEERKASEVPFEEDEDIAGLSVNLE